MSREINQMHDNQLFIIADSYRHSGQPFTGYYWFIRSRNSQSRSLIKSFLILFSPYPPRIGRIWNYFRRKTRVNSQEWFHEEVTAARPDKTLTRSIIRKYLATSWMVVEDDGQVLDGLPNDPRCRANIGRRATWRGRVGGRGRNCASNSWKLNTAIRLGDCDRTFLHSVFSLELVRSIQLL